MYRPLLVLLALAAAAGCASRSGDDLALNGNLAGALDAYAKKDTYEAHLKMGLLHQTQGDHRAAIAQFSLAIPKNAEADYRVYQYRAESYLATGRAERARADLEEALRRNPRVAAVHFLLGNALYRERHLDEARAAYDRALAAAGDNAALRARILKNRALAHFRAAAFDRAAADYEAAVRLGGDPTEADRYHLGLLLYAAGREPEAHKAWSGLRAADRQRLRTLLDEDLRPGF